MTAPRAETGSRAERRRDFESRAERRRDERDRLLLATLPHVPFDGWTRAALDDGCESLGLPAAEGARLFPGGMADLADHFADWADRRMLAGFAARDTAALKVRERIHRGVRLRLEALEPWREAARRGLSWLALPGRQALATRLAWRTVDRLWYAAGDRSADFNHYTKRGLLLSVYAATALYWLSDASEGRADTWAFLDRRIADVMKIPQYGKRARETAARVAAPFLRPFGRMARRAREF